MGIRKLAILTVILALVGVSLLPLRAQSNYSVTISSGAPVGTCVTGIYVDIDATTGKTYTCVSSAWVQIASLSATGFLSLGPTPPACTVATAGAECLSEGTAFTNVAGAAGFYPDSTAHEFIAKTNGSATGGILDRTEPGAIRSTGLVASVSTATLCAASAGACNVAGTYHVHVAMYQSGTACTANTTNGVLFQLTWTDGNGTAHSAQTLPLQTNASLTGFATSGIMAWGATTLGAWASADLNIDTNGTIIQYATTFSQCTTGTATYALSTTVTRLN